MLRNILITIVIIAASGCSSLSGIPERSVNIKAELTALKPYFVPSVITTYNGKATSAEKQSYRNEVLSARVRAIDLNYNEFIKNISAENKKLNIGTDSTVLVLSAAGALSTVTSTQAIIAATSATAVGVKSSIDKNSYYDSTLNALVSQMQATRQKELVTIYTGMELSINTYPLMRALIDIEKYFQAGTVLGAVNEINKQAGELKAEADEEIATILKSSYKKDKSGDLIRSFWKPNGKTIDTSNQAIIKAWMKRNKLNNISMTFFLRSEHLSEAREKAVKDIPIQ